MSVVKTAKVIINNPSRAVDKAFNYICDESVRVGCYVTVPFGRGNTPTEGVVIGLEDIPYTDRLKKIISCGDILLTKNSIDLLCWMRDKYVCTYYDCLKCFLPPGSSASKGKYFGAGSKKQQFAVLADISDKDLSEILAELEVKAPAQARVVDILSQTGPLPVSDLVEITATSRATVTSLSKKGIVNITENEIERNPFLTDKIEKSSALKPTDEQKQVIDSIKDAVDSGKHEKILLRGITGSGKTEVYLQSVEYVISKGKRAVILVPEIALTPQMSTRFTSRFGNRVSVFHSGLSFGERYDAWNSIKTGKTVVVVGARSAVFTSLDNVGIVVVDEEHETSYKSDMSPKYDAREVAEKICEYNNAVLLLASATPEIGSAYKAVKDKYKLLQIKKRYNNVELPHVNIVDLRYELARGNKSFLSFALQDEIETNLKNHEQTILFLNRRGFSTFVSCRHCGFAATCPECDIALTYHKYGESLSCHYCGYTIPNYSACPQCGSPHIRYFGIGTQKVEEEIHRLFPDASVIRMDNDTTRQKLSHHKILNKFKDEKIDILVGTQMITKGLDFPEVSLVGVLAADMMLYVDDYKASERTFQLITQVCGRAGRGEKRGRAIIQTYCPDHWVISCAKEQDYRSFYKKEILMRKKLWYPPFSDIICVIASGEKPNDVKKVITDFTLNVKKSLEEKNKAYNIMGPSPAPISKISNKFRWRVIFKCGADDELREVLRENLSVKKEYDVTLSMDINPNSVL